MASLSLEFFNNHTGHIPEQTNLIEHQPCSEQEVGLDDLLRTFPTWIMPSFCGELAQFLTLNWIVFLPLAVLWSALEEITMCSNEWMDENVYVNENYSGNIYHLIEVLNFYPSEQYLSIFPLPIPNSNSLPLRQQQSSPDSFIRALVLHFRVRSCLVERLIDCQQVFALFYFLLLEQVVGWWWPNSPTDLLGAESFWLRVHRLLWALFLGQAATSCLGIPAGSVFCSLTSIIFVQDKI